MTRTIILASLAAVLAAYPSAWAAEPNDDFASATVLAAGVLSVTDSLEGHSTPLPDTYLGAFADDTFTTPAIDEDDDSGPAFDGLSSAIFDVPINPDGSIHLAVTGCCDDFGGTHSQEGYYDLLVEVFDGSGAFVDSISDFSTLSPGVVDEFSYLDAAWIGGSFDAYTDYEIPDPGADPLDFWVFMGLTPGQEYAAETSSAGGVDFDTMLALMAGEGDITDLNDDDDFTLFSRLDFVAPAGGEVTLAVTGFADFDVLGIHPQVGDYTLTLRPIPEPATALLVVSSLAVYGACRRRV